MLLRLKHWIPSLNDIAYGDLDQCKEGRVKGREKRVMRTGVSCVET